MRNEIIAKRFSQERALYNLKHTDVLDCVFAGGGSSALKDARDVKLETAASPWATPCGMRKNSICTIPEWTKIPVPPCGTAGAV